MSSGWRNSIQNELCEIDSLDLRRQLRELSGSQGPIMSYSGRKVVLMASNNYLGLANHPLLVEASMETARDFGTSSVASPLISGHMESHARLMETLSNWKGKEEAILFGSGFLANLGLISALVGRDDVVFSDELNHASIIDGCRLSRAEIHVFAHGNAKDLEKKLCVAQSGRRKLIVVDGIFSMDGDLAPLDEIAALAEVHDAILLVDEAHASGVLGPEGRGAAAYMGVQEKIGISMGTMGKALGSYGAFACADREVVDYLVNRCRSFIFSTALPPATVAASLAAVELVQGEEGARLRRRLALLCAHFRAGLRRIGFRPPEPPPGAEVPIFPIVVGEAKAALALAEHMLAAGFFVLAIRPPTVPEGTCRLRATLMATHTVEQLDAALNALEDGVRKLGITPGAA